MTITTTDIQLFQILKEILGEKEAEALVSFVDAKIKENNETNLKTLSTKEDINKLEVKIAETKVEILRWTFGFFIALMLALIGLYFKK